MPETITFSNIYGSTSNWISDSTEGSSTSSSGGSSEIKVPMGANEVKSSIMGVLDDIKEKFIKPLQEYPTFLTDHDKDYKYSTSTDYKYYGLDLNKYESDILIGKITKEDHTGNINFQLIKTLLESIGIAVNEEPVIKNVSSTQYIQKSCLFVPQYTISYVLSPVITMLNFDSSLTTLDAEPKVKIYSLLEYSANLVRDLIVYYIIMNHPESILPLTSLSAEFFNLIKFFEKIPSYSPDDLDTIENTIRSISDIRDLSIMFRTALDTLRKQTIMSIDPTALSLYLSADRPTIKQLYKQQIEDHLDRVSKIRNALSKVVNCTKTVMSFNYSDYNIAGKFTNVTNYTYSLSNTGTIKKESKQSQTIATESIIKIAKLLKQPIVSPPTNIACNNPGGGTPTTSGSVFRLSFPTPNSDDLSGVIDKVNDYSQLRSKSISVSINDFSIDDIATLDEEYDQFQVTFNGRAKSGSISVSGVVKG